MFFLPLKEFRNDWLPTQRLGGCFISQNARYEQQTKNKIDSLIQN